MSYEFESFFVERNRQTCSAGIPAKRVVIAAADVAYKWAVAGWGKYKVITAAVLSLLVGLGAVEFVTWLAARKTLLTYMAFIPPSMESAGLPHKEIRVVTARAVIEGLNHLLQDYDRLCQEHPLAADARQIDCDRVHKMSREPIPEN